MGNYRFYEPVRSSSTNWWRECKIEGFYDACKLQGLTGKQGVIIPRQNMQHLMLRQDVIDAVRMGQFHIHAIDTIDQALEILMARPVGTLDKKANTVSILFMPL